jgi:CheY-like chemotaxis protein
MVVARTDVGDGQGLGVLVASAFGPLSDRLVDLMREQEGVGRVAAVATAQDAVALAVVEPFDAILLDLDGQWPDGLRSLGLLRAMCPATTLVALACEASVEARRRCAALGADALVDKAHDLHRLGLLVARRPVSAPARPSPPPAVSGGAAPARPPGRP